MKKRYLYTDSPSSDRLLIICMCLIKQIGYEEKVFTNCHLLSETGLNYEKNC